MCHRFLDQRQHSNSFMSTRWRRWWKTCFKEKTDSSTLMVSPILERLTLFRVRFLGHICKKPCFDYDIVCSSVNLTFQTLAHRHWSRSRSPAPGSSVSLQETAGSSVWCHGPEACDVSGCEAAGRWWGQGWGNPQKLSAQRGKQKENFQRSYEMKTVISLLHYIPVSFAPMGLSVIYLCVCFFVKVSFSITY